MKKLIAICAVLMLSACMSAKEKEFNASGRAKAILDPSDMMPVLQTELLNGTWVSDDDPLSEISFESIMKIDTYDGEEMSRGIFRVHEGKLEVKTNDDLFEYEIMELSETSLVLLHLPRGNVLKYTRSTNDE